MYGVKREGEGRDPDALISSWGAVLWHFRKTLSTYRFKSVSLPNCVYADVCVCMHPLLALLTRQTPQFFIINALYLFIAFFFSVELMKPFKGEDWVSDTRCKKLFLLSDLPAVMFSLLFCVTFKYLL